MAILTQCEIAEILELFKTDTSVIQLSKESGYTYRTIKKYWKMAGLDYTERGIIPTPNLRATIEAPKKCGAMVGSNLCKGTAFWRSHQKDHYCCSCRSIKVGYPPSMIS